MKKKFFALMMAMVMVLSPAACGGCADADRHGAVLGFHRNKLRMNLSICHILCKILWNLRGGRNGERAHYIRVDLPHGNGHSLVAGKSVKMRHYSPSP